MCETVLRIVLEFILGMIYNFHSQNSFILLLLNMGRKKDVSIAKWAQASLLHDQGWSQWKIAKFLDISRCGIRLVIEKKQQNPETSFKSAMRPGRKKNTLVQTDRAIIQFSKMSPRSSSAKIQAGLPKTENVSLRTARRCLFNTGLKSRKPAQKPLLDFQKHC